MQSTLHFLQSVLPVANYYVGGVKGNTSKFLEDQKAFTTIEALANYLDQMCAMGWCTYYGCSGFEKTWHEDPYGTLNAKGNVKKVLRTQQNAVAQRTFWLDIDVNPTKPSAYDTLQEAADSLVQFIRDLSLPMPKVVCSGGGLHVYFVLREQIDRATWNSVAGMIDSCVKHYGLKVDPSRTTDAASILRPAPSMNFKPEYKPNGAPVSVKFDGQITDVVTLKSLFSQYMNRFNLSATPPPSSSAAKERASKLDPEIQKAIAADPALRSMLEGTFEEAQDKDAPRIIKMCPQIANAGHAIEPVWMGMMTVMKCCEGGREYGRQISMQDARHTDQQYNEKYDRVEGMSGGPAKCSWFQRNNPDGCMNCPYNGRITSPAELGRLPAQERIARDGDDLTNESDDGEAIATTIPIAQNPAVVANNVMGIQPREVEIFKIKSNIYDMVPYEGLFVEREEKVQGEIIARKVKILEQSFFLTCAQKYDDFFNPEVQYIFLVMERGMPNRQIRIKIKDLISMPAFLMWCGNNQLMVYQHNEKDFLSFMKAYLAQLQKKVPQIDMRDNFGWITSKNVDGSVRQSFVVGTDLYSSNTMPAEVGLRPGPQKYAEKNLATAGTLEGWLAVPRFYKEHNVMWGQLGICMAFGAVLMKFAPGTATNGIVNFWSTQSGTGKSTLQQVVNSVWGHYEEQMIQVHDTNNSRYKTMGWRCNLPICIDETTNVTDYDLSNLLFEISEGREKNRMNADLSLQDSGSWQTITIMSANNTVMDKMVTSFVQREAEIKRVIDIPVAGTPSVTKEHAVQLSRAYQNNYGHAGRVFLQNLLDNDGGKLIANMSGYMDAWVSKNSKGQDERFWENTMAATVIGGRLAKAMGLIDFDMVAVEKFAKDCITGMRGDMVNNKRDGAGLFSDFLSEFVGNMLVVASERRATPEQPGQRPELDSYILRMPRGNLDIRMEVDTGDIYVRAAAFTKWCGQYSISPTAVLAELAAKKMLDLPNQSPNSKSVEYRHQKRLATGVSSLAANMTRCYKINLGDSAVAAFAGGTNED